MIIIYTLSVEYNRIGLPSRVQYAAEGAVEQNYHYYPDEGLGAYDFGARLFAPADSRWTTPDPLAEKYYHISPYAYCAGDHVNLVDPDGRDVWEIDNNGRIVRRIEDKTQDSFYLVAQNEDGEYERTYTEDEEGNKIYDCVSFAYGTIESQRSITFSPDGKSVDVYDVYSIRGDDNGKRLFEFLAENVTNNSNVEIGHAMTGIEGDKGLNFVTTSHEIGKENGLAQLFRYPSSFDVDAREVICTLNKKKRVGIPFL